MKKIIILLITLIFLGGIFDNAYAACIQCPEIQKLIKKEFKKEGIKLSKEQKKQIKETKKSMKNLMKSYDKKQNNIQKDIDNILKADCPDIVKMMELKNEKAKIQKDRNVSKKEFYDELFYIYTPEQQYVAKRVLSENSDIRVKKHSAFCLDDKKLQTNCAKCNKKK